MFVIQFLTWFYDLIAGTSFTWSYDVSWFQTIRGVISIIGYVLPLDTIVYCINFTMVLMGFRVIISMLKTIMAIIPFV